MEIVTPKMAAACIIMHNEDDPHILMGRRNDKLRFMGGHHVFPGGRVDLSESTFHIKGAENEESAKRIHAVAREVFEETGLLPVRGDLPPQDAIEKARRSLLAEDERFEEILQRFDLDVYAEDFIPAGHWITPPPSPIRFDTKYYIYWLKSPPYEQLIVGELTALDWLRPADARKQWREGILTISPPVAYAIQCLAQFRLPQALTPLRNGSNEDGRPKRFEFDCGISIVPLITRTIPPATHTNCVFVGEEEIVVIDPGPHDEGEIAKLKDQVEQFKAMGADFTAIVLTHSHVDHVGAVEVLRDTYGLPVWAHQGTAGQVSFAVDRILEDNEVITLKGDPEYRLRCIHTPGHDPGHLCFMEEISKVLLCGDMVANPGTIIVSLDFGGDMTQYLESLERLLEEDIKHIIPSHGMRFDQGVEKIQETIDHRLMREGKVKAALDQGLTTVAEMLPVVYDDTPEQAWPLAEHALKAHLARLGVSYS